MTCSESSQARAASRTRVRQHGHFRPRLEELEP
jgi:hypothetical protein